MSGKAAYVFALFVSEVLCKTELPNWRQKIEKVSAIVCIHLSDNLGKLLWQYCSRQVSLCLR
tara:strand:- start:16618 stop:16803 length:186 start_codon:yes stop_codon:yes gene_type:complete